MKYRKANKLNDRVTLWMNTCVEILEATKYRAEFKQMDEIKYEFEDVDFDVLYNEFLGELVENITEYRNIDYIEKYIEGTFKVLENDVDKYDEDIEGEIIINKFEVKFLLKVVKTINEVYGKMEEIYYSIPPNKYSIVLLKIFNEVMISIDPDYLANKNEEDTNSELPEIDKFDFDNLRSELIELNSNKERTELVHNRMIDFEQWHIKNYPDENDSKSWTIGDGYASQEFYKLCEVELKRYDSVRKKDTPEDNNKVAVQNFKWTGTPTEFLELFTALYKSECIKRKDNSPLTRKDFLTYFQQLFMIEIKDLEGLLARATNRKTNRTPFLDSLKTVFENYADEKLERQSKR